MNIQTVMNDDTAEVSLTGNLVADTAEQVELKLAELIAQGVNRVTLNLRGVNFIDSSGLNVFIGAHKQLRARQGLLILLSPAEAVRRVFKITGAEQKFHIATTREECLSLLRREPSPGRSEG